MKRWCCVMLLVCFCISGVVRAAEDYRNAAAVDLAIATMTDDGPAPAKCSRCNGTGVIAHGDGHQTACPDCQPGCPGLYGNPLDTYRDAKTLIAKGNELADRGKAILDAAEADGKIMLSVHLPKVLKSAGEKETCPGGVCPYRPTETPKPKNPVTTRRETVWHTETVIEHRPRLLGRLRR